MEHDKANWNINLSQDSSFETSIEHDFQGDLCITKLYQPTNIMEGAIIFHSAQATFLASLLRYTKQECVTTINLPEFYEEVNKVRKTQGRELFEKGLDYDENAILFEIEIPYISDKNQIIKTSSHYMLRPSCRDHYYLYCDQDKNLCLLDEKAVISLRIFPQEITNILKNLFLFAGGKLIPQFGGTLESFVVQNEK